MKITKNYIIKSLEENSVSEIKLQFTAFNSNFTTIDVNITQIEKILNSQFTINPELLDEALSQENDLILMPDLSTFVIGEDMNGIKIARLICDLEQSKQIYPINPRITLNHSLHLFKNKQWNVLTEFKANFYLIKLEDDEFVIAHNKITKKIIIGVKEMCKNFGVNLTQINENNKTGQFSVSIDQAPALIATDQLLTFKWILKEVAKSFNIVVNFMPKSNSWEKSNSLEISLTVFEDNKNIFFNPSTGKHISIECNRFTVGILNRITGITAFTNSSVNSFKRLSNDAANIIGWSITNFSTILHIKTNGNADTAIVIRNTDLSANPYLALALLIASGYEGIRMKVQPIPAIVKVLADLDRETLIDDLGVELLPETFGHALVLSRKNEFCKNILGAEQLELFYKTKIQEWNTYQRTIHSWEISKYLLQ